MVVWSDEEAYGIVRKRVEPYTFQAERFSLEEVWVRNTAYFAGKHHFYQDGSSIRPILDLPEHRVLYKANLAKPAIIKAIAKIMNAGGQVEVAPDGNTRRKRRIAQTSNRVLAHMFEITDYQWEKMMAYFWAALCGMGILKVWWNPAAGDPDRFYRDPRGGPPTFDVDENVRVELEREGLFVDLPAGEVEVTVVSPFNFKWDWGPKSGRFKDCRWLAEDGTIPKQTLVDRFGEKAEGLVPTTDVVGTPFYEELLAFMSSGIHSSSFGTHRTREDLVRYIEYWEKPARNNGWKGRLVILGGDRVMLNGPAPYAAIKGYTFPYVKVPWVEMPGRFTPLSMMEDLTPAQFQYNKARATVMEFQNIYGHPSMFVPENSGIQPGILTVEPGAVYSYNPLAGPPVPGPTPNLGPEIIRNGEECRNEIQMMSADTDPDTSRLPAQIRSGVGLRYMQEEKDRALSPTAMSTLKVDRDVGRLLLGLGKINYRTDRVMKYTGRGRRIHVESFRGADLSNDVMMVKAPYSVDSPAARRAELLELATTGFVDPNNPQHRRAVMREFGYNEQDVFLEQELLDEEAQERENEMFMADPVAYARNLTQDPQTGMTVPPPNGPGSINEWDDHAVHARVSEELMKSEEFQDLDPIARDVIVAHWRAHRAVLQQQFAAMQAVQANTRGAPGETGAASQPRRQPV